MRVDVFVKVSIYFITMVARIEKSWLLLFGVVCLGFNITDNGKFN